MKWILDGLVKQYFSIDTFWSSQDVWDYGVPMVGSKISNRKKVLNETWCAEAGAVARGVEE